jgi:broad specificity phosphatase PhoE
MSKLILMRHTEVEFSPNKYLGREDVSLSEKGRKHAEAAVKQLKKESINVIYSSGLKRSIQTADILAKGLGLEVKASLPELNELDFGVIEGLTRKEAEERYPDLMKKRDTDRLNFRVPEGESPLDGMNRALPAIERIAKKNHGKNVLIIIHGLLMRTLLSKFTGRSIAETYKNIEMQYGCMMLFETISNRLVYKRFVPE